MNHVRECYHQKEKPKDIVTDYNGKDIKPGKRVAFNYQGSVRLGTIVKLKRCEWKASRQNVGEAKWWSLNFELLIQGDGADHVSKIKNPNSIAIID